MCIERKRAALFMPFDLAGDFPFTNYDFYWWFDHQQIYIRSAYIFACTHATITTTTMWMFFHISFSDARNLWLIFLWIIFLRIIFRFIFRFIFLGINFGNHSENACCWYKTIYPAIKYTALIYIVNDETSLYITSSDDQLSNCICLQY